MKIIVKKLIIKGSECEEDIMALKDQVGQVTAGIEEVKAAVAAEKEEIRGLVDAVKDDFDAKIAALEAKVNELENTDLSAEIQGLKDTATSVGAISDVLNETPEEPPVEPVEPVEPVNNF